mmetsp:Transcript_41440/g.119368  ORF Transcript_41440/g.119368 Transcript_41440/m.119368 type:complete len:253 (+) Transcript_41440:56-814(+)
MGAGTSGDRAPLLGACGGGAAPRAPGAPIVFSVVRTTAWGLGDEEDVWQVEVPAAATVADVKQQVETLYEVPAVAQSLSLESGASAAPLDDAEKVEPLCGKRLYLNPAASGAVVDEEGLNDMAAMMMGAVAEAAQVDAALVQSLEGVTYNVTFERPQAAGGAAAGKKARLTLDPLAFVGDVQQMVEVELFGATDKEPAFLIVQGRLAPAHMTLFHAGVEDGSTVTVAKERPPPTEEEMMLQGLMAGGLPDQA